MKRTLQDTDMVKWVKTICGACFLVVLSILDWVHHILFLISLLEHSASLCLVSWTVDLLDHSLDSLFPTCVCMPRSPCPVAFFCLLFLACFASLYLTYYLSLYCYSYVLLLPAILSMYLYLHLYLAPMFLVLILSVLVSPCPWELYCTHVCHALHPQSTSCIARVSQ